MLLSFSCLNLRPNICHYSATQECHIRIKSSNSCPVRIQEVLLHALNANTTNWPTAIQNHALALLRSGEITTFPALINQVLDDVREQTAASNASSSSASGANGKAATNGDSKKVNGAAGAEKLSLAVPTSVVEEAMKITRECLDAVCEIEPSGSS